MSKKIFIMVSLFLVVVLAMGGCIGKVSELQEEKAESVRGGYLTYDSSLVYFEVDCPAGWEYEEDSGADVSGWIRFSELAKAPVSSIDIMATNAVEFDMAVELSGCELQAANGVGYYIAPFGVTEGEEGYSKVFIRYLSDKAIILVCGQIEGDTTFEDTVALDNVCIEVIKSLKLVD